MAYKTNRYTVPAAYRSKRLDGLLDLSNKTLLLRYEGQTIRTLILKPSGAKEMGIDPHDAREHFEALWKNSYTISSCL